MRLSELLQELGEYTTEVIRGDIKNVSIKGCKLLVPNQITFSPEILYYCAGKDFPVLPADMTVTILFQDKDSIPKRYWDDKNIVMLIPKNPHSAEMTYNQIYEVMTEEAIIVSSSQRLMEALFSDLGLQHIVDVAFEITGHPIYVVDTSFQYLAISRKEMLDKFENPVLTEENKLGFIADAGVRLIKKANLDEAIRKSPRPFYFENKVLGGGTLIDLIKIHNVEVGHVMMYEADEHFTHFDRVLLTRLADMVSLELRKNSFYKHNRGILYSYFLADLLKNGVANYKSVSQRLQVLGFTLKEQLYVMVVDSMSGRVKNEPHMEVVANQLHWLLVGSMYVIYQDRLVMLISRSEAGITEFEYAEVGKYLESNSLIAGISNCFVNIQDIRTYYSQACKAAELGEKHLGRSEIYHYCDLSVLHMFSICEANENLMHFCSPKLLSLLEYDKSHNTDLTNTLYQYLLHSQNSIKASANLSIHKNTLLYRIEKVKKIIGSTLENGEELMQLHISFNILRYLKQI